MFLAIGVAACALAALVIWLWPLPPPTSSQPSGPGPEIPRSAAPEPSAAAPAEPEAFAENQVPEASEAPEDTTPPNGDLLLYAARPLSAVPHHVVRAWGASDDRSQLGLVGAYLIVDPGISNAQLIKLCRDIQEYHRSANGLSVRILDSEAAATYDRQTDGGALESQHQVATVTRDAKLGVDAIYLRGELVKP